eukprot:s1775_g11.t1
MLVMILILLLILILIFIPILVFILILWFFIFHFGLVPFELPFVFACIWKFGSARHLATSAVALHVWHAWHLATWTATLCGRHWAGSGDGLGRHWSCVAPRRFCVAGAALGDICLHFVWQAWHLATWTVTYYGRCGNYGTGLALVTALVGVSPVWRRASFAWQARHLATSAFVLWQAWHLATSAFVFCGRRGSHGTGLVLVEASVAAGRLRGTWHLATSAFVLCGRRGTHGTGLAPVATLVAAGRLRRRASFAWQAWHLVTSAFGLCGRRALGDISLRFWVVGVALTALGGLWWRPWSVLVAGDAAPWHLATSAFVLCGRRGTHGTGLAPVATLVAAGRL